MKKLAKTVIPGAVWDGLRSTKVNLTERVKRWRGPQAVFQEIYREKAWGQTGEFNSGPGSHDPGLIGPYVEAMRRRLTQMNPQPRVVDLGCGDFNVGSKLIDLCSSYTAVDIVPELIEAHRKRGWGPNVQFVHLNIINDPLPPGDVCFVRQVLQHLSNAEIRKILSKLRVYRTAFITEHHPEKQEFKGFNFDKPHGGDTRITFGSGVFLDQPPFGIDPSRMETVLELADKNQGGIIRTFMYSPPS